MWLNCLSTCTCFVNSVLLLMQDGQSAVPELAMK